MMSTTGTPVKETEVTRCPLCDAPLESPDRCSKCDWVKDTPDPERVRRVNPVDLTACLFSIVPGMGHYYKGHKGLAWLYLAGAAVAGFFAMLAAAASAGFGIFLLPLYWAWMMTHAYWIEDLKAKERFSDTAQ